MKKIAQLLVLSLGLWASAQAEEGGGRVVDKAVGGVERGAKAAAGGIEKGADATAKGVNKGVDAMGRGLSKAGGWLDSKLGGGKGAASPAGGSSGGEK